MKAIQYACPPTLDEAVALLAERNGRARVLAGGTDIIVQVREGRRDDVNLLVDVKKIPEVNQLTYDDSGGLVLGAAVPCYLLCRDEVVRRAYPGLIDAASIIGGVQIQGRASIGGNLCNASPAADSIPPLIALEATCVIRGPSGQREVPVERFCTGPGKTVLERGELLVSLRLPPPAKHSGAHYLRFIPRNEMDIAVVGAGARVVLDASGQSFTGGRVALAAVAPTPLLVEPSEELLRGSPVSDETIARVVEAARTAARPISDMRGTVDHRRHLAGVLTRRALQGAIRRAKGETA